MFEKFFSPVDVSLTIWRQQQGQICLAEPPSEGKDHTTVDFEGSSAGGLDQQEGTHAPIVHNLDDLPGKLVGGGERQEVSGLNLAFYH